MTPQGKFLARVTGKVKGNVILREQQYASSKNEEQSLEIARNCILGKVHNARSVSYTHLDVYKRQIFQSTDESDRISIAYSLCRLNEYIFESVKILLIKISLEVF